MGEIYRDLTVGSEAFFRCSPPALYSCTLSTGEINAGYANMQVK